MSEHPLANAFGRVQSFVDDLREQGIHVGLGADPKCVTCGEAWPCAASAGDGTPAEGVE